MLRFSSSYSCDNDLDSFFRRHVARHRLDADNPDSGCTAGQIACVDVAEWQGRERTSALRRTAPAVLRCRAFVTQHYCIVFNNVM
jgi:hypothetical protein